MAPRRGSIAYLPRARAARLTGRIRYWPEIKGGPAVLGFAGYKAGMTRIYVTDNNPSSPNYGKEVVQPVTIIETPPMIVCAIRTYVETVTGLQTLTEIWAEKPPKDLERVLTLPEKFDPKNASNKIEQNLGKINGVFLFLCTQPRMTGAPKKKPDMMEVKVGGGSTQQQLDYAHNLLGKTVNASDVLKEGLLVDVIAITKGKGIAGAVKRWGVHMLPHKGRKTKRGIGTLGPWHPAHVMYTVPRAGQLGLAQRTEYCKQILKIGSKGAAVTPEGGFIRYGVVNSDFIILRGSIPGPAKRLVKLRYSARAPETPKPAPQISSISLESQQGR